MREREREHQFVTIQIHIINSGSHIMRDHLHGLSTVDGRFQT